MHVISIYVYTVLHISNIKNMRECNSQYENQGHYIKCIVCDTSIYNKCKSVCMYINLTTYLIFRGVTSITERLSLTSNRPRHVWNIGCMHVTFISKRTDAFITKYCCKLKGGLSGNSCPIMAKYFKWRLVRYAQSMCYFLDFIDQVIILCVFSISYHERCFQQLIHILSFWIPIPHFKRTLLVISEYFPAW